MFLHARTQATTFLSFSAHPATQIVRLKALFIFPPAEKGTSPVQKRGLTEIFGGAPGPGLALAQGEAALSAQETPHPCPACSRARSSQPIFTPSLGVDAARVPSDTLELLLA